MSKSTGADIVVLKISNESQLQHAFKIRTRVFVEEQNVPPEDELDEHEDTAVHFLAYANDQPAGTARYRYTDKGIKLERFAVLKEFRRLGLGKALMNAVMQDITSDSSNHDKICYLHGQVAVINFYQAFGFMPEGDQFDECGIMHYLMKRKF
ncbi:MAG: GNAT family N-acetyltransferase [Cyclobacteriaceae bacterium]